LFSTKHFTDSSGICKRSRAGILLPPFLPANIKLMYIVYYILQRIKQFEHFVGLTILTATATFPFSVTSRSAQPASFPTWNITNIASLCAWDYIFCDQSRIIDFQFPYVTLHTFLCIFFFSPPLLTNRLFSIAYTSTIPASLGKVVNLISIRGARYGEVKGTIPDVFHNLTSLTTFSFDINRLSGSIPLSLAKLQSLEELILGNNHILGIPAEVNWPNMIDLYGSLQLAAFDWSYLIQPANYMATFSRVSQMA